MCLSTVTRVKRRDHHTDTASTSLAARQRTSWGQDWQLGIQKYKKLSQILTRVYCHANNYCCCYYTQCHQTKYLAIWLMIFISPQKVLLAPSSPLRGESALSLWCVVVTDVLLQLDDVSRSTYLPVCEARNSLHRIQKTTENIHVSDGLRCIVTVLIIAL